MRGAYGKKQGVRASIGGAKNGTKGIPEKESVILAQILRYLEMRRIVHWRMPVQGVMHSGRHGVSFSKSPIAGFPDIAGLHRGTFFAVEVKTSKGKVSDLQAHWIGILNGAGGCASVVRSLIDVDELLVEIEARATLKESVLNIAS